jgi:glycosyltransferase involved in cell wall biosynthesis
LPPAADNIEIKQKEYLDRDFAQDPLTIFYVGGLGNQYQITELVKAVGNTEKSRLVLCCRDAEWKKEKQTISPFLNDRIEIIHKSSDELEPFYQQADLCSLLFKNDLYIEFAKPFKAYEYLAHELPALATDGTAIGEFVKENDIGWAIPYESDEVEKILKSIIDNSSLLMEKKVNCTKTKGQNLWINRACRVAEDLS